jgi:hypothetical protein
MRRLLKWIFLFIMVPLAVLLIVLWAAFQFIPQDRFRLLAAEKLGRKMNRQLILGPIHVGLRGLDVDELQLSEIPNFDAGTFLTAKGLRLGWDLKTLWEGLNVKKKFITRSSGHFHVDEFHNPHYSAKDFSLTWSLSDLDPSWSHLNGSAALKQGSGLLQNVDQLVAASPSAKLALTPVTLLMHLERLGFLNLGLPDLRRWPIQSIVGDYHFKDGVMSIKRFSITSPQLGMETSGAVELASGELALDVELQSSPRTVIGSLNVKMRVSGTLSNPKADLRDLKKKAFKATISNLLQGPAGKDVNDALKKIFQ